jgi:hypothetical protein
MRLNQLRDQLADLKKKEVIAQTREQLLNEEKQKLLGEVETLFKQVRELGVVSEEELTPSNLQTVAAKLQTYIEEEISKSKLPPELS